MRNEGATTAKMKRIKQNERQDCETKIYFTFLISIFSENTVHACRWPWKRKPLPGQEVSTGMQVSSNTATVPDMPNIFCKMVLHFPILHRSISVCLWKKSNLIGYLVLAVLTRLQRLRYSLERCNKQQATKRVGFTTMYKKSLPGSNNCDN